MDTGFKAPCSVQPELALNEPKLLWRDAADTYAALVTSWWAGGYTKV
jgi:hypothetical protein